MLDFLLGMFEVFGEPLVELFFAVFANMFSIADREGPEILSVVPRLPAGAGVLLAKGGR